MLQTIAHRDLRDNNQCSRKDLCDEQCFRKATQSPPPFPPHACPDCVQNPLIFQMRCVNLLVVSIYFTGAQVEQTWCGGFIVPNSKW